MRYVATTAIGLALGLFVGLALGQRQGFIRALRYLQGSTSGGVALDVEVASCIRVGDTERALALLDARVDGAVLQLTAAKQNLGILAAATDWDADDALARAKAYRGIVPPSGHDAKAVSVALQAVPAKGAASLSPGLAMLAQRAHE
jgi:hypothetical protein